MSLITSGCRGLANGIDKVYTSHPLIVGELDLAGKVMNVSDQSAEDLAVSGGHVRAHGVQAVLCEVRIEAACARRVIGRGSHCDAFGGKFLCKKRRSALRRVSKFWW